MKRYQFLSEKDVYSALNKLRDAFLAASNGDDVNKIINGLLTPDERLKIGRRILVADAILNNLTIEEISQNLSVGKATVLSVYRSLEIDGSWYQLISKRSDKVEKEYQEKKFVLRGGSLQIKKRKEYSGFKRKEVKR